MVLLLGNSHLHQERLAIDRWQAGLICSANPMPVVLIDWADVPEQQRPSLQISLNQAQSPPPYSISLLFPKALALVDNFRAMPGSSAADTLTAI